MTEIQNDNHDFIDTNIDKSEKTLTMWQADDTILLSTQGAKQLIEILKEFVGEECKRIAVDENGECLHFHTTFGRGECFDCGKKLK